MVRFLSAAAGVGVIYSIDIIWDNAQSTGSDTLHTTSRDLLGMRSTLENRCDSVPLTAGRHSCSFALHRNVTKG